MMCSPGMAVMAGGALFGAYGQAQSATAQNSANEYNAQILERNAQLAEMDAKWVEQSGDIAAANALADSEQARSTQRASFGSSGVVVDSGSTQRVTEDTMAIGALDAITIQRNAKRESYTIQQQGENYRRQAGLSRLGNVNAERVFWSSLLTTGAKYGSQMAAGSGGSSSSSGGSTDEYSGDTGGDR